MFCLLWSTILSEDDVEEGGIKIKKMAIFLGRRSEKR
jgi:hypothetical protein